MTHRRLIVLVTLSLLIGSVINVGVAWWAAQSSGHSAGAFVRWSKDMRRIAGCTNQTGWTWSHYGSRVRDIVVSYGTGYGEPAEGAPRWSVASQPCQEVRLNDWEIGRAWSDVSGGWPFRSMTYRIRWDWDHGNGRGRYRLFWGYELDDQGLGSPMLPLKPLGAGFVLNSGFYAVVTFLIQLGFCQVRFRVLRHRPKQGQCVGCGYDRSGIGDAPCPECGREAGA